MTTRPLLDYLTNEVPFALDYVRWLLERVREMDNPEGDEMLEEAGALLAGIARNVEIVEGLLP